MKRKHDERKKITLPLALGRDKNFVRFSHRPVTDYKSTKTLNVAMKRNAKNLVEYLKTYTPYWFKEEVRRQLNG